MSLITINIVEELPTESKAIGDIKMNSNQTVATLKRDIVAKFTNLKSTYPPSKQKLYHNDKKLEHSTTVDVIGDNGTVRLRHENITEVFYCIPNKSTIKRIILVNKYDTIIGVKGRILQIWGLDPAKHYVTYCANDQAAVRRLTPETLTGDASGIEEFGILNFIVV